MLVSLKEIGKYVDISGLSAEEIASRLTSSGIEVEEIKHMSSATNLVIGEVISCEMHPDSDHLHVTKVDVKDEILDIVCGAPNCRKGLKVIVAKAGAMLPKGEIKKGEIRGQVSNGMLCALNELGVDPKFLRPEQIAGIEELPSDAPVGETDVLGYLGLDDVVLDLSLLANRSDCYSLYNVAREIGALFNRKVTIPEEKDLGTFKSEYVTGSETPNCDEFYAEEIRDIKVKESPNWLKNVLRSQNIRSINNIVDIGNYAMLLTGQPIHMYDIDKLKAKELIVRNDFTTEVVALDDKTYSIIPGDLLVTSGGEPVCIAGVMGLKNVEVDVNTKNILVEVARFEHSSVRKTSSRLGLISDSSQRFVKEVNPHQSEFVLKLVARLVNELCEPSAISKQIIFDKVDHATKIIKCSYSYINNRLGTKFSNEVIKNTLSALNFKVKELGGDEFEVEVPPYRIDIGEKADLSEEVVRYNGFENVESALPYMETTVGGLKIESKKERAVEDFLLNNGFDEVLTYTLINDKDNEAFNYINKDEGYVIKNPLTEDRKNVRRNMLSSLLRCMEYNVSHSNKEFKIFEVSPVQTKKSVETHLTVGLVGEEFEYSRMNPRKYSYFDVKGILDTLLKMFNIQESRTRIERLSGTSEFHPNRSAIVYLDGKVLAVLGELHPLIKGNYTLDKYNAVVMEMNLSLLFRTKSGNNKFTEISKYQSVTRDYAFIIKDTVKFQDLRKEIKKTSSLVKNVEIFDIYKGEHISNGYLSMAVKVYIEASDHTLKDNELSEVDSKIMNVIASKFNGEIRRWKFNSLK